MASLKRLMDGAVFASALLGLLFLYEAAPLVPSWLLDGIAVGEAAYVVCAIGVARGYRISYYAITALAVLVLALSLPQPEHYSFASGGEYLAFFTFAAGTVLQVCLLVAVPVYLVRTRRR